jgi:hypothetical protein
VPHSVVDLEGTASAPDFFENLVRLGSPDEGLRILVVTIDIVLNGSFKLCHRGEAVATDSPGGAAVLDVCRMLKLVQIGVTEDDKALLERIAKMLTKLIKARSRSI